MSDEIAVVCGVSLSTAALTIGIDANLRLDSATLSIASACAVEPAYEGLPLA